MKFGVHVIHRKLYKQLQDLLSIFHDQFL